MTSAYSTHLNDATRARSWEWLRDNPVDVLVVGGGITGVGVALDAITRGFSVALVEARDFASGTSGFSSKLVHGGLRYLASGDIGLAWESALERRYLMSRIAPHLVHPVGFIVPRGRSTSRAEFALTEVGVRLADVLRRASGLSSALLPRPRRITARETRALLPGLDPVGLRSSLLYWDGRVEDDARLVLGVARTAAGYGARMIRDARVLAATATEATIRDERSGELLTAHAGVVVNATGVWAQGLDPELRITPSRGTHLVFRAAALGHPRTAYTVPVPGSFGRFIFVLPQANGLCYLGLTDESDPDADGYAPEIPETDELFLLDLVNTTLARRLKPSDIVGRFAGLRPLVGGHDGATDTASRHHVLEDRPGEPITIAGGKLTTYRAMAEQTVDAVARRLGSSRRAVTTRVSLIGAHGTRPSSADRLDEKYGSEARTVRALIAADESLGKPVFPGADYLAAEVIFAVVAEGAHSVEDILERRSRLSFVPEDAAAATERIAELRERARSFIA